MSLAIRQGEHTFGSVAGGSPLSPQTGLDIGPSGTVHLHCPQRIIFVWGEGELHVHEHVDEIWAHGNARLHIHFPCRVNVSGKARADIYVKGGFVVATERAKVHVHTDGGVPVHYYDDTEIWAGTGPEVVCKSEWTTHHKPDGTTRGPATGYRSQVRVRHY